MEIRVFEKMDYLIANIFHTILTVTTKQKKETKTQIINKEKTKKHNIKNCIAQLVD